MKEEEYIEQLIELGLSDLPEIKKSIKGFLNFFIETDEKIFKKYLDRIINLLYKIDDIDYVLNIIKKLPVNNRSILIFTKYTTAINTYKRKKPYVSFTQEFYNPTIGDIMILVNKWIGSESMLVWNCTTKLNRILLYNNKKIDDKTIKDIIDQVKNNDDRLIVFYLILAYRKCSYKNENYHANIVIYDRKTQILERFDPNGEYKSYDQRELDDNLITFFDRIHLPVEELIEPVHICPYIGIQELQGEEIDLKIKNKINTGTCAVFSLYYLQKRLENSNVSPSDIIANLMRIIKQNKISLTDFIIEYSHIIKRMINDK